MKGWPWGAFLLNWIWAIGNKTWIGLLALVPYVGFIMALVLGFKGREWAWKAQRWESVEHFNRVQKKWSFWGVLIVVGVTVIGILAAIAVPAYTSYKARAAEVAMAQQQETMRQVREAELQKQMEEALQQAQQQEEMKRAQAATAAMQQTAAAQADQSTVEQGGICKGLDMAVTADQYECQSRKFSKADGELNATYKELMASLEEARRPALKREQIAWIKEKESKCAKAGKEAEGGSMEGILINDCKIAMTEERVEYLHAYN